MLLFLQKWIPTSTPLSLFQPARLARALLLVFLAVPAGRVPAAPPAATRVFAVRDYGARPNTRANCLPAIERAIAAAMAHGPGAEVVFEAGEYRITGTPGQDYALELAGAQRLTLRGVRGQTKLIQTNPSQAILRFHSSRQVTLRDLTTDYDPLPFTQGRVTSVNAAQLSFDLALDEGYPSLAEPWFVREPNGQIPWGMVFDPVRRELKAGASDAIEIARWSPAGERRWRFQLDPKEPHKLDAIKPGDRFVQLARRSYGTLAFSRCTSTVVENLTVHASPGLSLLVRGCRDTRVSGYRVEYAPGSSRLISSDSDGLHIPDHQGSLLVERCRFEGMADDGINIHNRPAFILSISSPTLVRTTQALIKPGDRLMVMDLRTGRLRGESVVTAVSGLGGDDSTDTMELRLANPIPGLTPPDRLDQLQKGADVVFNLSRCGAGFVVRDNHFGPHRRFGLYISSRDGLIERNRLERNGAWSIVFENECSWWVQGPPPANMVVRDNTIRAVGYSAHYGTAPDGGAIRMLTSSVNGLGQERLVRNMLFERNVIEDPPVAGFFIGSAADVRLKGNLVRIGERANMARAGAAISVVNGEGVHFDSDRVESGRHETTAGIAMDTATSRSKAGARVVNLRYQGPAKTLAVCEK